MAGPTLCRGGAGAEKQQAARRVMAGPTLCRGEAAVKQRQAAWLLTLWASEGPGTTSGTTRCALGSSKRFQVRLVCFTASGYEPEGREFESLRAHHFYNGHSDVIGPIDCRGYLRATAHRGQKSRGLWLNSKAWRPSSSKKSLGWSKNARSTIAQCLIWCRKYRNKSRYSQVGAVSTSIQSCGLAGTTMEL